MQLPRASSKLLSQTLDFMCVVCGWGCECVRVCVSVRLRMLVCKHLQGCVHATMLIQLSTVSF